jgi:hypothetical protein
MSLASFSQHTPQRRADIPPATMARPLGAAPPPALHNLLAVVQRLEEAVEQETAALEARAAVDLNDFNNRKSQGLLDLNRALRQLGEAARDPAVTTRLAALRARLARNQAVLKMHLDAVREVATIVADAIRESESDGTYSQSIRSPDNRYAYD